VRYFFDLREGDQVALDDEGIDFPSVELAQQEATLSLANLARDLVLTNGRNGITQSMAVNVRDKNGPVLKAEFAFEIGRANH
jgi:hypothetical protein